MSAKSATGLAAPSVQKLVIDSDVEYQLRSFALHGMLKGENLSHVSTELYWRCPNLTAIWCGDQQPFWCCTSLVRIDLAGCPKLECIPKLSFCDCHHLVSVVFGEHSSITILREGAFLGCSALTSITLPNMLEIIEDIAFVECTSLERIVFNKNLKLIGRGVFQVCEALKSVTLPNNLKLIYAGGSGDCPSLERVVFNKNLSAMAHSTSAPSSKMPSLHPAQFLSVVLRS